MTDPTALIDSQALGTDLANALIHTIVEAHHVITSETKPPVLKNPASLMEPSDGWMTSADG